jgi:hypothetical protein
MVSLVGSLALSAHWLIGFIGKTGFIGLGLVGFIGLGIGSLVIGISLINLICLIGFIGLVGLIGLIGRIGLNGHNYVVGLINKMEFEIPSYLFAEES